MKLQEFCDMKELKSILSDWAVSTGLGCTIMDPNGQYISELFNYKDFCTHCTRGTGEGKHRCEKCDREGKGIYECHTGLTEFSFDLKIGNENFGRVIGGQAIVTKPDPALLRMNAKEIGVNPEQYLEAIDRMPERTQKEIEAAFHILQTAVMSYVSSKYNDHFKSIHLEQFSTGIRETEDLIKKISDCNGVLQNIQKRQKIVAINASIEAARVGQAGKGFAVVAEEVEKLSENSSEANKNIEQIVNQIRETVAKLRIDDVDDTAE
uniref:Putative sensor domain protein n=1 Tax=Eubacterium cellulosolvens (strain ATCC 43171 / JCM 9499 / 6) TaxID=633697 RepID=I5ARX2_EUBC6